MMIDSAKQGGGLVRSTRVLIGIAATAAIFMLLAAGSANAKTVYKYVYSGESFDGSGSTKGQFKSLAGIDYEPATEKLYVSVPGSPGVIDKFNKNGTPANFSALNNGAGRDYIDLGSQASGEVSVDNSSNASTKGNIYLQAGGTYFGYHPNGLLIEPAFTSEKFGGGTQPGVSFNQGCGATVGPNGEFWDFTFGNGQPELNQRNLATLKPEVTYLTEGTFGRPMMCNLKIDTQGNFYGWSEEEGSFAPHAAVKLPPEPVADGAGGTPAKPPEREKRYRLNASCCGQELSGNSAEHFGIDRSDDDVFLVESHVVPPEFTNESRISLYDSKGSLLTSFGGAEGSYLGLEGAGGITVDPVTHDVYVTNNRDYGGEVRHVEKFVRGPSFTVPTTDTEQPSQPEVASKATLQGTLNPDGIDTTECYFEYGETPSLGSLLPCNQGQHLTGSSDLEVTATASGLKKGTKYWVKLFAVNANGVISDGGPEQFLAQSKPISKSVFVSNINTDGASLNATIDPNGGRTWYYWEFGPDTSYGQKTPEKRLRREDSTELELPPALTEPYVVKDLITGLQPGEPAHFRLVTRNEQGTAFGADEEFITYVQESEPSCPNALVRQQTGSALLLDCRAYELASTPNSGGHDVVSSIVQGEEPLISSPGASGRLLYSLDSGVVPGASGEPTNLGRDPYVAVRGNEGWTTEYVGLPSGGMADSGSFGSPLLETDNGLNEFAFGGENICNPCFADGATNVPLRRSNGALEEGMAGSLNPAANPAGEVRKHFSADGSTFVFGAEKKFEAAGNEGSVSIYSRDLQSGAAQVVSTLPDGSTMTGAGIAELDMSANGERVLVGEKVGEDSAGNEFFDLYMHDGTNPDSIEVVSTPNGVEFNGMTSDGSKVFFTTPDKLADDTDNSNDFFVADVGTTSSTITRLSTGTNGTGNTDACEPITDWNVVSGGPNCGTAAIAGGGGVASGDGTAYFVSPELLDGSGNGSANQANLYVVKPGGSPHFVATIDSSLVKPGPPPPNHPIINTGFATGLSEPQAMTVDQSNGDLYVIERTGGRLSRFDSTGAPHNFTAGPGSGTNTITGLNLGATGRAEVAVDNASGSLFQGDFYLKRSNGEIGIYAPTGAVLGELTGFGDACGVAVDPSSGVVYVGDRLDGTVWRFEPKSATSPVENADYEKTGLVTQGMQPCNVAADGLGNVYASAQTIGPAKRFEESEFGPEEEGHYPAASGTEVNALSRAMSVDPSTNDLYLNEGNLIKRFDSSGNLLQIFGSEESLGNNSRGVAVYAANGHVFAPVGPSVTEFGIGPVPYEPINNPAVVHGVHDSATHSYEDFQVTPDGRYALFSSVVPVTGYANQGHSELYRYDATSDSLACASCAPTLAPAQNDVKMTPFGLSLTDGGRVFFTTKDSFVLRDTNGRSDAYEWSNGTTQLISAGLGPDDSAMLTVTADGKDAFFFTRDVLSRQDGNGSAVKIYDAREGGGFLFEENRKPCAASDECHGAGTEQPPAPDINTATGEGPVRQASESKNCDQLDSKAKKANQRAAQLRRKADKSSSSVQAKKLRKQAKQASKEAKALEKEAKACRGGGK